MPIVVQSEGKKHIKNIAHAAWVMYGLATNGISYQECVKIALEDHRKLVEEEIRATIEANENHECL